MQMTTAFDSGRVSVHHRGLEQLQLVHDVGVATDHAGPVHDLGQAQDPGVGHEGFEVAGLQLGP